MQRIGLREASQNFSRLKAATESEGIVAVTNRGEEQFVFMTWNKYQNIIGFAKERMKMMKNGILGTIENNGGLVLIKDGLENEGEIIKIRTIQHHENDDLIRMIEAPKESVQITEESGNKIIITLLAKGEYHEGFIERSLIDEDDPDTRDIYAGVEAMESRAASATLLPTVQIIREAGF